MSESILDKMNKKLTKSDRKRITQWAHGLVQHLDDDDMDEFHIYLCDQLYSMAYEDARDHVLENVKKNIILLIDLQVQKVEKVMKSISLEDISESTKFFESKYKATKGN